MITVNQFEKAREIIRQYETEQSHIIRDDIFNDCPTKDFTPGEPKGDCETDGHFMCEKCIHCDINSITKL